MSHLLIRHPLNQSLKQSLITYCRNLSGQVATKDKLPQEKDSRHLNDEALQTTEKLSQMYAKHHIKRPTRPPFVRNIFLGRFDTEILTYPEALDKDSIARLEKEIQSVQFYFDNSENLTKKEFWNGAKQLNLFGLQVSQIADGRELNLTETLRFCEVISQKSDDIQILSSAQAVKALLDFGTERQMTKYLQGVTAGKITMALCVAEEGGFDPNHIKTTANFDANKKQWVLNGKKNYVTNGNTADLFLVLAKTKVFKVGMHESDISALLVERNFGGVTSKQTNPALGIEKSDISEVMFENTHVPEENLLGKENKGVDVYSKILPEINLMNAVSLLTIVKKSYNNYFDHVKNVSSENNTLLDTELVSEKLSDFATRIYAMESMIYLTSGLYDLYTDQDCHLEATITKIFSVENSTNITSQIMQLIGPDAYFTSHWSNSSHRNALYYLLFNGTPDSTKIILALQGLQFAGVELQGLIKRLRNPLFHTKEVFTRMWTQRRNNQDNPRLTLQLGDYLHPTALPGAEWLEYSVLRVQFATELLLASYGIEVPNKHTELIRLAECVIDIYAMVAALGRASRSYCIGLSNADNELLLACSFCQNAMKRVQKRVTAIQNGPYVTHDVAHEKIAARIKHFGGYYPEHPLKRNY